MAENSFVAEVTFKLFNIYIWSVYLIWSVDFVLVYIVFQFVNLRVDIGDLNRMLGVKSLNVVEEKMARVLVQKISNFSSQILEAVISLTEIDQ